LPKNKKYVIHDLAGAHYITPILKTYSDFVQIDKGCKIFTRKYICSVEDNNALDIIDKYTYILHYDRKSWINESIDKNGKILKNGIERFVVYGK
jgi:hypothetical protein